MTAVVKFTGDTALAVLGISDHLSALKTVLFALDSRAQKIFEAQLAIEQQKSQQRFEELKMLLAALQTTASGSSGAKN